MKRVLYIGLVVSGTLLGWLLLIRPTGARDGDRGIARQPPNDLTAGIPAALWNHPRWSSVVNGVQPNEAERFFRAGRQLGDREMQRLLQPKQDEEPILMVSPELPVLPDEMSPRDRRAPQPP